MSNLWDSGSFRDYYAAAPLFDLYDIAQHIDSVKHPDRYRMVWEEIHHREELGEFLPEQADWYSTTVAPIATFDGNPSLGKLLSLALGRAEFTLYTRMSVEQAISALQSNLKLPNATRRGARDFDYEGVASDADFYVLRVPRRANRNGIPEVRGRIHESSDNTRVPCKAALAGAPWIALQITAFMYLSSWLSRAPDPWWRRLLIGTLLYGMILAIFHLEIRTAQIFLIKALKADKIEL